jgi:hypothetical protein
MMIFQLRNENNNKKYQFKIDTNKDLYCQYIEDDVEFNKLRNHIEITYGVLDFDGVKNGDVWTMGFSSYEIENKHFRKVFKMLKAEILKQFKSARKEKSWENRYGVDISYFSKELKALEKSLPNRPHVELYNYLIKLANVALPSSKEYETCSKCKGSGVIKK